MSKSTAIYSLVYTICNAISCNILCKHLIHVIVQSSLYTQSAFTVVQLNSAFQAFIITVIVLCFVGYLLVLQRITIQTLNQSSQSPPDYINALFAGPLLEVLFLASLYFSQSIYNLDAHLTWKHAIVCGVYVVMVGFIVV